MSLWHRRLKSGACFKRNELDVLQSIVHAQLGMVCVTRVHSLVRWKKVTWQIQGLEILEKCLCFRCKLFFSFSFCRGNIFSLLLDPWNKLVKKKKLNSKIFRNNKFWWKLPDEVWYKNRRFSIFFQNGHQRPSWISEHTKNNSHWDLTTIYALTKYENNRCILVTCRVHTRKCLQMRRRNSCCL